MNSGDRLALVGPSGAGKTLLLRQLAWLDPLQRGQILLRGRAPGSWTLPVYRSRVAYVQQRAVAFAGAVKQNLGQVLGYGGHCGQRPGHQTYDEPRILSWLDQLGR